MRPARMRLVALLRVSSAWITMQRPSRPWSYIRIMPNCVILIPLRKEPVQPSRRTVPKELTTSLLAATGRWTIRTYNPQGRTLEVNNIVMKISVDTYSIDISLMEILREGNKQQFLYEQCISFVFQLSSESYHWLCKCLNVRYSVLRQIWISWRKRRCMKSWASAVRLRTILL